MTMAEERSDSIRMIRDSAAAVAPPGGDLQRVRALRFKEPGFDKAVWQEMCQMGWTGLMVPEASGGVGLGMQEMAGLLEELGAGLVPEPLIEGAMAARLLTGAALEAQLQGRRLVLPAWQERAYSLDAKGQTRLDDGKVTGRKVYVPLAAGADAFLVTTQGGLALVEADAPGVTLTTELTQDGGHVGTLDLDHAPATPVDGDPAWALEEATLATAAYLLGLMDRAFALTLDYLRTRQQFGRPIGSFQALQHRAADLKLQLALSRASVESAAVMLDGPSAERLKVAAVSRAKSRASDAAMFITRQAVQLHGAIGYTDEADIGLYLRRVMVLANRYGAPSLHRRRWAELMGPESLGDDEDD
jgi:alkylation response protein AidB-like acyl-CoA dehydrogenase